MAMRRGVILVILVMGATVAAIAEYNASSVRERQVPDEGRTASPPEASTAPATQPTAGESVITPTTLTVQAPATVADTDLYKAYIRSGSTAQLIVSDTTSLYVSRYNDVLSRFNEWNELTQQHPSDVPLKSEAILDFTQKASGDEKLENICAHITYCEVVDADEITRTLRAAPDWSAFHKRFPGAKLILKFSRAGYDSDKSQALMVVEEASGPISAVRKLVFMVKRGDRWAIEHEVVLLRA